MTYRGHIEHGVVVFDEPVALEEGTSVSVEAVIHPKREIPTRSEFWHESTIAELAAKQGLNGAQQFDQLFGQGASLWESDPDCQQFVRDVHERRQEGLGS